LSFNSIIIEISITASGKTSKTPLISSNSRRNFDFSAKMETSAKRQKLSDEAQQRMDPLRSAVKEYMLQELMFQHFTGNEVKQLFEVSTLWNEIASNSVKCGAELKLTIRSDDDAEKLTIIETSGRKYAAMKLESNGEDQEFVATLPLLLDIVASIRWSLKELEVKCPMNIEILAQLLSYLNNLESLILYAKTTGQATELPTLQLPKLKQLKCTSPSMQLIRLFRNVTSLEELILVSVNGKNVDVRLLEDFILRQEKLKNLLLVLFSLRNPYSLFADKKRLNEMKFQLETIITTASSIHPNSAAEFFNRQQSLKTVELYHFSEFFAGTREEHCVVLRSILTLQLNTLRISGNNFIVNESFIDLEDIRNTAVKFLALQAAQGELLIDGKLVDMFPNLHGISVAFKSSKLFLSLRDVRCEKLSLIQCKDLSRLFYRPPLVNFDQTNFEAKLEEFLLKNHQSFEALAVGRLEWIAMDIKLSLSLWKKVLDQSPNLVRLNIIHPGNVNDLVNLLSKCKRNLVNVHIQTNDIGVESAKEIEIPSWLQVYVPE
jgi:hypothetical protein